MFKRDQGAAPVDRKETVDAFGEQLRHRGPSTVEDTRDSISVELNARRASLIQK